MLFLLTSVLAAETIEEPATPMPPTSGMRIFLGGGQATSQGGMSPAAEMGFHITKMGRRVGGEYGLSLSAYELDQVTLPVFNLDGGLRWRPSPDWRVQPYVAGGVGVSFLVFIPVPSVSLALGGALQLGELSLDLTLRARQLLDIYGQTDGVLVNTLEVGVGF